MLFEALLLLLFFFLTLFFLFLFFNISFINTARFFIASISMASKVADGLKEARDEPFWTMRGVAITVATDYE